MNKIISRKFFLLISSLSLLFMFALSGCQTALNNDKAEANLLHAEENLEKTSTKNKPKNYYASERIIRSAILAVKKFESPILKTAAQTLFQNLQKNQDYEEIIMLFDEQYPSKLQSIIEKEAKIAFPETLYKTIKIEKDENAQGITGKLTSSTSPNALILLITQYSLTEDSPELLDLQKRFLKNTLDNFTLSSVAKLPFSTEKGLEAIALFNTDQKNSKAHPQLIDLEKGFIIQYFSQGQTYESKIAYLTFMGDIMLGRTVRTLMNKESIDYPFEKMDQAVLKANDLLIGNIEGPIAEKAIKTSKAIAFRFLPDIAPLLKKYHFDVLSLANNHALDMGKAGLEDSYKFLKQEGIVPFGNPREITTDTIHKTEVNGIKFAFIGLNDVDFKVKPDEVISNIKSIVKEGYKVIIFPHWGIEYRHKPSEYQIKLAHDFIDAGATMIVGAHPHVVQSYENYKGRPIFYSLGNAVFDQYFSEETQEGLIISLEFTENLLKIYLVPANIKQSQLKLMDKEQRAKFLDRFSGYSSEEEELKEVIKSGILELKLN